MDLTNLSQMDIDQLITYFVLNRSLVSKKFKGNGNLPKMLNVEAKK